MIINTPVIFFVFQGDIRKRVFNDKFIYASSFDREKDQSVVIIKVQPVPQKKVRVLEKEIEDHYKKFGKISFLRYFEKGIEIQEAIAGKLN